VKRGKQRFGDDLFYHVGKDLLDKNHPLLSAWRERKIRSLETAIAHMGHADTAAEKRREWEMLRDRLKALPE
jgi:hypothetical protein